MMIDNINILFVAQYAASYEGNFVQSLVCLENSLKKDYNCKVAYVFPNSAKNKAWYGNFIEKHLTYTVCDNPKDAFKDLSAIKQ